MISAKEAMSIPHTWLGLGLGLGSGLGLGLALGLGRDRATSARPRSAAPNAQAATCLGLGLGLGLGLEGWAGRGRLLAERGGLGVVDAHEITGGDRGAGVVARLLVEHHHVGLAVPIDVDHHP